MATVSDNKADTVMKYLNDGTASVGLGVALFLLLTNHWVQWLYYKIKNIHSEELYTLIRKIWMILFICGWAIMNTSTFSLVWGWLTIIVWMLAHNVIFQKEEQKNKFFPILLAVAQSMSVIMWFVHICIKGDQRRGVQ